MKKKKGVGRHGRAKEMFQHMENWEKSGQSQAMYQQAQGLGKSVFEYWLRRYRAQRGTATGGFVAVGPPTHGAEQEPAAGAFARVHYADGREVVLYTAVPSAYLRELLA